VAWFFEISHQFFFSWELPSIMLFTPLAEVLIVKMPVGGSKNELNRILGHFSEGELEKHQPPVAKHLRSALEI